MDQTNQTTMMQPAPKKRKTWLWVLISIVGVIVILGGLFVWWIFGGSTGNAKGVAEDWLTQLSSSQVDSAYEMTATAYKEGTNKEQFDVFLEAYPIMSAVQEVSFESVERQSTNGQSLTTLTGTITGTDGTTSPIEMMLISEGEDWKVYNVDLRGL